MKLIWPDKGDLVSGHNVWSILPDLPALNGKIVAVSKTGHKVKVDFGAVGVLVGTKTREFTWRRATNTYQDVHDKTRKGAGLALQIKRKRKRK